MQNRTPLRDVSAIHDEGATPVEIAPERLATVWAHRLTGLVGVITLILALSLWAGRPGHYRPVLALLVVAMFCAILHSYTFGSGDAP